MRLYRHVGLALVLCAVIGPTTWAATDLRLLNVFPNPVRVYLGHTQVTFDNVTDQLEIRILDTSGTLVRELSVTGAGNQTVWNLQNASGEQVGSGIYVFVIKNSSGEKRQGKIAVIR